MKTKKCYKCEKELPLTIEFFNRVGKKKNFSSQCNECRKKHARELYKLRMMCPEDREDLHKYQNKNNRKKYRERKKKLESFFELIKMN